MAISSRRRTEPAASGSTHTIGTIAKGSEDIERVALDTDRAGFNSANKVFAATSVAGESATFIDCSGKSKVWIAVEYANNTDVNDYVLVFKDFESTPTITYGRIFVPSNLGITANVLQASYNKAALMSADCSGFQFVTLRIITHRVASSAWLCPV